MVNQIFDVDDPDPRAPTPSENKRAAELYRDARLWRENARALWAYRVMMHAGWSECVGYSTEARIIERATAVFPSLPADVRAKLGERP